MLKKRVQSHVLEKVIMTFMVLFGLAAIYVFYAAMGSGNLTPETAIMEMLIIVVLVMLGQTAVLIKIYEQTM